MDTTKTTKGISPKYKSLLSNEISNTSSVTEKNKIHDILEKEKQNNKWDSWNKLDKMTKINKLHQYADTYTLQNKLSPQECIALKEYLVNCINQSKLQKSKEVFLDKEKLIILDIPSLFFHPTHRHFTLRSQDAKRVSTLKSLTVGTKKPIVLLEEEKEGKEEKEEKEEKEVGKEENKKEGKEEK